MKLLLSSDIEHSVYVIQRQFFEDSCRLVKYQSRDSMITLWRICHCLLIIEFVDLTDLDPNLMSLV